MAMSAGNYGKAFAFAAQQLGLPATVVMPGNAPVSRIKIIEVRYSNSEVTRLVTAAIFMDKNANLPIMQIQKINYSYHPQ